MLEPPSRRVTLPGMTILSALASFALVAGLMTIVPGLDSTIVMRTAIARGRRRGFATALGVSAGVLIWGSAAAVGVSALLVASHLAYDLVRFAGAAYIVWLGGTMIWRTLRRRDPERREAAAETPARGEAGQESVLRAGLRGFTTNLLNPKIGVFYVSVLPQFIPAQAPHLLTGLTFAGVHVAEGVAWFTVLIVAAHLARKLLDSERGRRIMDRVAGVVLIGFGVKLAVSSR